MRLPERTARRQGAVLPLVTVCLVGLMAFVALAIDVGMMAVVLLELGFTPEEMTGLAILSTFPGLIAHVSEELQGGQRIRVVPDEQVDYGDPADLDLAEGLRLYRARAASLAAGRALRRVAHA